MLMRYEEEFAGMNSEKAPTSQQSKTTVEKDSKIAELTEKYEQGNVTREMFLDGVRAITSGG